MRHAASNSYLPKNAPSFSRHFQSAFLDGGYPRVETWVETLGDIVPFQGKNTRSSLKLTPMGARPGPWPAFWEMNN